MARVPESTFTQYVDRASAMLCAVTGLLGHVSDVPVTSCRSRVG